MGLLYGGIAAAGYYYFGDGSAEVVTANLKRDSPFAGGASSVFGIPGLTIDNAIGAFVLLNAFTTYPALIMIVQDMIWALVSPAWASRRRRNRNMSRSEEENDDGVEGTTTATTTIVTISPPPPSPSPRLALVLQPLPRFLLRLAAATLTASVAVGAYSAVADCIALLGGASSMSCSLLLPAACYLRLATTTSSSSSSSSSSPADAPTIATSTARAKKKMTPAARRALIAMLVAGTALTAAVVAQSVGDLIKGEGRDNGDDVGGAGGIASGSALVAVLKAWAATGREK